MNEIKDRLLLFFGKSLLIKQIGEEINYIDFPELSHYISEQFKNNSDYVEKYPIIVKNIVSNISKQIFETIKTPILYTYNELHYQKETDVLKIIKRELLHNCFNKFPELERILSISSQNYIQYFTKLFKRLLKDEKEICKYLGISGNPISIDWPLGDFHNNGETHATINYSCGSKVVYKVKCPDGNLLFEKLIKELFKKGYDIPFLFPKRLNKNNYYWEEYIEHIPTDNEQKLKLFYETIGKYLAIFYVLGISDIIRDNIITNEGIPIFIDIECLLKPILKTSNKDIFPTADNFLKESVIGTGLLPFWTPNKSNNAGTNFGGISQTDVYTPKQQLYFGNNGKIIYEIKNILKSSTHIPFSYQKLNTNIIYSKISDGFTATCKFIMTHKKWINEYIQTLIYDFDINSRVLMRHTSVYDTILKESLHPDYLNDSQRRNRFLNYLDNSSDEDCFPKELIEIEKKELKYLNVPIFYSKPNSKTVFYKKKHFDIIQVTGLDAMIKRLNRLTSKTVKEQNALIEKSIACFETIYTPYNKPEKEKINCNLTNEKVSDLNFVKNHVIQLAEKIINDSVWIDESLQWIDIGVGRAGQWEVSPKKPGLYDGLDGLGLFYLYLFDTTNIKRFKKVAESILRKSLFAFEHFNPSKSYHLFSPFNFPFSTLYFYWHYQEFTGEKKFGDLNELLERKLIPFVQNHVHSEPYLDVANGCSGLLIFLLDYYNRKGLKSLELPIHLIVQKILKSAIKTSKGITWQSEKFKKLVGFAHGNAGFLYSLSKYYGTFGYTNTEIKLLEDIIRYNKSYFSNYHYGWRDLRYNEEVIAAPSWCHGSSGILLAYLEAQNQLPLKFDIDWNEISNTIIQKGFTSLHCLCHGMAGNAEALIAISNYLDNPYLKSIATEKILSEIRKNQNEFNWRTGFTNGRFALNGLYLGTSGIAYNLLKILVNPNLPSFLTLQAPGLTTKTNKLS